MANCTSSDGEEHRDRTMPAAPSHFPHPADLAQLGVNQNSSSDAQSGRSETPKRAKSRRSGRASGEGSVAQNGTRSRLVDEDMSDNTCNEQSVQIGADAYQ